MPTQEVLYVFELRARGEEILPRVSKWQEIATSLEIWKGVAEKIIVNLAVQGASEIVGGNALIAVKQRQDEAEAAGLRRHVAEETVKYFIKKRIFDDKRHFASVISRAKAWQDHADGLKLDKHLADDGIEQLVKANIENIENGNDILDTIAYWQEKMTREKLLIDRHLSHEVIEQLIKDHLAGINSQAYH